MESNISKVGAANPAASVFVKAEHIFELHGYCYADRMEIIPELTAAFTHCGGWMLERRTLSAAAIDFRFEMQLAGIQDLYASMVEMGIELTRSAHAMLTDLCTCRQHITRSLDPCQILTLRLEISFLSDVTLHSILMTGSAAA